MDIEYGICGCPICFLYQTVSDKYHKNISLNHENESLQCAF